MWGTDSQKQEFGLLYPLFNGSQEKRNYAKGIQTVKRLAGDGYVPAICQLGQAYFDHLGVRRSYPEAFRLYLQAAQAGYPSAECGVGNFYAMAYPKHEACEYDEGQAVQWWRRAAEHGNPGAQCNLAGYCLQGVGVQKDPAEAYLWASLAVHCSTIRFRSAEVFRDQAAALLGEVERGECERKIAELKERLPLAWSEHLSYWQKLFQAAGGG